jgi:hypothetical protein
MGLRGKKVLKVARVFFDKFIARLFFGGNGSKNKIHFQEEFI